MGADGEGAGVEGLAELAVERTAVVCVASIADSASSARPDLVSEVDALVAKGMGAVDRAPARHWNGDARAENVRTTETSGRARVAPIVDGDADPVFSGVVADAAAGGMSEEGERVEVEVAEDTAEAEGDGEVGSRALGDPRSARRVATASRVARDGDTASETARRRIPPIGSTVCLASASTPRTGVDGGTIVEPPRVRGARARAAASASSTPVCSPIPSFPPRVAAE